jgi:type 1 fimbria pilin
MKKTLLAMIFISLLIFSLFVSSAVAEDVTITIKGGLGCTVTIQNNENYTINTSISIVSYFVFREGGENRTVNGPIGPYVSISLRSFPPGIESIYAMGQAGNLTVKQEGISLFRFVFLFNQ